jgi:hypothetical protein
MAALVAMDLVLINRMIRAARLDAALYEEVEADHRAMAQAIAVVLISGFAAGVGGLRATGPLSLLIGTASAVSGWLVWAGLTYVIGAKLFPEPDTKTDLGQMLRTIGFASSPGVIRVAGVIPGITEGVFVVAAIWMLAAMVVASRQALDYRSTSRAVGVCVLGWLVQATVFLLLLRAQGIDPRSLGQLGS